jgi:hypothetical protein
MKRHWNTAYVGASAMACTAVQQPSLTIYQEPIGPAFHISKAPREKPEGRAAARRRRQMAKRTEGGTNA